MSSKQVKCFLILKKVYKTLKSKRFFANSCSTHAKDGAVSHFEPNGFSQTNKTVKGLTFLFL